MAFGIYITDSVGAQRLLYIEHTIEAAELSASTLRAAGHRVSILIKHAR